MSGDETKYWPEQHAAELLRLTERYGCAAEVLAQVRDAIEGLDSGDERTRSSARDLVCWPNRFDIGFYVPAFAGSAEPGTIRVGFTAGEVEEIDPRFFVRSGPVGGPPSSFETVPFCQLPGPSVPSVADELLAKVRSAKLASSA